MIPRDKAIDLISQRSIWDTKQRIYYALRHDGVRRINKPFATAADFHFPLIDMTIGDLKPFWVSQVFSGERLADFVAMARELEATAESAADFLTFDLRHRSDFRLRTEESMDTMLLRGRGIIKSVWDPLKRKIINRSIDPNRILIDQQFADLYEADFFVEIQTLSTGQYQRNQKFNQDRGILSKIKGRSGDWNLNDEKLEKEMREGVTHSTREDQILLWNIYEQTPSGWIVDTRSPIAWDDVEICKPHGVNEQWQGETLLPFDAMTMELKDPGWYSARGIAELLAPFEVYATKLWNEKADYGTFVNKPLFGTEQDISNTTNVRIAPGEILPSNIKPLQMPSVPMGFADEINFTRQLAERRSRTPDFGQFSPDDTSSGKPVTATQSRIAAGMQSVGSDHNGNMFREVYLSKILTHQWALRVQYQPKTTTYFIGKDLKELPEQAFHDQYLIIPAGGNGTKQERLQRAVSRYQLFKGDPDIDQLELKKDVLAADDSRLVTRLVVGQDVRQGKEAEDEAMEIGIMLLGFPATVGPGEDHVTRIKVLVGFLEKAQMTGQPVDPIAKQRIGQHLAQHFQYLQQLQPQVAKQLKQAVTLLEQQMAGPQAVAPNGNGRLMQPMPANQPNQGYEPSYAPPVQPNL